MDSSITLHVVCNPIVNFSVVQSLSSPIESVIIENHSDKTLENLELVADSATDLMVDSTFPVPVIPAQETVEVDCRSMVVDTHRLLQLTERVLDGIKFELRKENEVLASENIEMVFWAFDQWNGVPEFLACFVTPNHPALAPILIKAAEYLKEWTGSSALDGYQSGDVERVRYQGAALFRAIQEQNIVYVGAPPSFDAGQRIRLADSVLSQHMGTCLDLAALYSSALEACGLRPLVVIVEGHAFAGFWLEDRSFPEIVTDDCSELVKRSAKGIDQMTFVECTLLAQGSGAPFEAAEFAGKEHLLDPERFLCAVDVYRARMSQLLPLPARAMGAEGWDIEAPKDDHLSAARRPDRRVVSTAVLEEVEEGARTKRQVWERSLLDLSSRNALLNMRPGPRLMPILTGSVDEIEDALAKSEDLVLAPKPAEWKGLSDKEAYGILGVAEIYNDFLSSDFKEGRLRTAFSESALQKNLTNLFRAARSSLEETGSNTLFMTLGTLLWVDPKRGNARRLAPLMLLPVDIVKRPGAGGYVIRLRDDEPLLNITLVELLKREFGINVSGLDPLPHDEHGIDTRLVLNTFKDRILGMKDWQVIENAALGLFSFSQFLMWSDVRNSEEAMRRSPIVNSLMEGHLTWQPEDLDGSEGQEELLLPIEADASQRFAIQAAVGGQSFVLHGPPGTGKSQTITAIIANALARGKKVLFVAEKMAALEVVQTRLARLKLAPFCLELHSTKATRNHVLEQIQAATELGSVEANDEYAHKLEEVQRLKRFLDTYARALKVENAAGLMLREQILRYETYAQGIEPLEVSRSFIDHIVSPDDFVFKMNSAERLIAQAEPWAPLAGAPLSAVTASSYSQELREELPKELDRYISEARLLQPVAEALCSALAEKTPTTIEGLLSLGQSLDAVVKNTSVPAQWVADEDLQGLLGRLEAMRSSVETLRVRREELLGRWQPSALKLNVVEFKDAWVEANAKGIFGRKKAVQRETHRLSLEALRPLEPEDVEAALRELEEYQSQARHTLRVVTGLETYLTSWPGTGLSRDWAAIGQAIDALRAFVGQGLHTPLGVKVNNLVATAEGRQLVEGYRARLSQVTMARLPVESRLGRIPTFQVSTWLEGEESYVSRITGHLGDLRDWMNWRQVVNKAETLGLYDLLAYVTDNPVTPDLAERYKAGVYRRMVTVTMDTIEGVNDFSRTRFEELVHQYTRADQELRALAVDEVYYRVAQRLPNLTQLSITDKSAARLQRLLRSRGRGASIRSLMKECGSLVRSLCPCFLMSPLSVSQYLEVGGDQFDLLIFDEASQLQTAKAVGALSRAKAAVVVGDPRQMPPTSFFQGKESEEDFDEVADLESVLEDCLALNLPQAYLRWHYRSNHESLIAFSNKRFYESKMLTFPSVDDRKSRVSYKKVDGFFDRGKSRTNAGEAEAIVAELVRRAHDAEDSHQTVGVITFNVPQQMLIQDLFAEACSKDPVVECWANEGDEPVFIKNLENVQGDERDVILFSITYAPDATGKMSMNFGPVNREGGWRRLNVAVTRARIAMMVFSSMDPTDIDVNRTSSMGPSALKAFLEFAQRGAFGAVTLDEIAQKKHTDAIADAVVKRLEDRGFEVHRNVGRSSFKVDLAVVDPRDKCKYLIGILLDGPNYVASPSTRDRELAQPQLLRRLGWDLYRIWSAEWWEDKDALLDRLVNHLEGELGDDVALLDGSHPSSEAMQPMMTQPVEPHEAPAVESTTEFEVAPAAPHIIQEKPPVPSGPAAAIAADPTSLPAFLEPAEASIAAHSSWAGELGDSEITGVHSKNSSASAQEESRVASSVLAAFASPTEPTQTPSQDRDQDVPVQESQEQETRPQDSRAVAYQKASVVVPIQGGQALVDASDVEIANLMGTIVDIEAPIEKEMLFRRVLELTCVARMGSNVQAKLEAGFKRLKAKKVSSAGRSMVWRKTDDPKNWAVYRVTEDPADRRKPEQLPLEEIIAATLDVLEDSGGPMGQDALVRAVSKLFGFKRLTAGAEDYIRKAFTLGSRRGQMERGPKNTYQLPSQ